MWPRRAQSGSETPPQGLSVKVPRSLSAPTRLPALCTSELEGDTGFLSLWHLLRLVTICKIP